MQEGVVLLHGIFRTSISMRSLHRFLLKQGFKVCNIDYASRRFTLQELAEHIHPVVADFSGKVEKVHFVGHSMGGLLTRAYLNTCRPENLGKVVMLGTPNKGSEVADKLQRWWIFRELYGPAGQQLITDQSGVMQVLGTVNYDVGIIAGNRTIDPIGSYIIGIENDGKVSVESTKLPGMKAHRIVPVSHTFLPDTRQVQELVVEFIKTGQMTNQASAST